MFVVPHGCLVGWVRLFTRFSQFYTMVKKVVKGGVTILTSKDNAGTRGVVHCFQRGNSTHITLILAGQRGTFILRHTGKLKIPYI